VAKRCHVWHVMKFRTVSRCPLQKDQCWWPCREALDMTRGRVQHTHRKYHGSKGVHARQYNRLLCGEQHVLCILMVIGHDLSRRKVVGRPNNCPWSISLEVRNVFFVPATPLHVPTVDWLVTADPDCVASRRNLPVAQIFAVTFAVE
jgi:hypothetical protein